jgi:hypothetical protein
MNSLDRLLLLCQLSQGELCVSDLENKTGIRQPTLSQQLTVLREERLVITRCERKQIYFLPHYHSEHTRELPKPGRHITYLAQCRAYTTYSTSLARSRAYSCSVISPVDFRRVSFSSSSATLKPTTLRRSSRASLARS